MALQMDNSGYFTPIDAVMGPYLRLDFLGGPIRRSKSRPSGRRRVPGPTPCFAAPRFLYHPTRWGPRSLWWSGSIPSYTHLQPWLNRVCWGYNYLITKGAPSCNCYPSRVINLCYQRWNKKVVDFLFTNLDLSGQRPKKRGVFFLGKIIFVHGGNQIQRSIKKIGVKQDSNQAVGRKVARFTTTLLKKSLEAWWSGIVPQKKTFAANTETEVTSLSKWFRVFRCWPLVRGNLLDRSLFSCPSGYRGLLTQIGNLIVCTKGNGDLAIKNPTTNFGRAKGHRNHRPFLVDRSLMCILKQGLDMLRHDLELLGMFLTLQNKATNSNQNSYFTICVCFWKK